jgi:hypothetical protein
VAGSRLGTIVVLFSMSESWTGLFLYFLNQTLIISLILEESEWKKKKWVELGEIVARLLAR